MRVINKRGIAYNNRRVKAIVASARKYDRTMRKIVLIYDPALEAYVYEYSVADRGSGKEGGRITGRHDYKLLNLYPHQREAMDRIPKE